MALILNTPKDPVSTQQVTLDGINIFIKLEWNVRNEAWYISVYDNVKQPIVTGIRLVKGSIPLFRYTDTRLPRGILLLLQNNLRADLGRENLGTDFELVYLTLEDIRNALLEQTI